MRSDVDSHKSGTGDLATFPGSEVVLFCSACPSRHRVRPTACDAGHSDDLTTKAVLCGDKIPWLRLRLTVIMIDNKRKNSIERLGVARIRLRLTIMAAAYLVSRTVGKKSRKKSRCLF